MKRLIGVWVLTVLWTAPMALGDDASKRATVEEILTVMKADTLIDQMMTQAKQMVASQTEQLATSVEDRQVITEIQEKVMSTFARRFTWQRMKPDYIRLYMDVFSEEELTGMLNFYKSKAGKAMLDKMPQITQQSLQLSQRHFQEMLPEFQKAMDEVMAKHKK